ncbi:hypothetical protein T265_09472 [Opisthorchis viverrini]|uniref:Ig-like domain-containing protein n=1 Tax=Opisthorchis viverrini TaxID=6198 RepID=A0A074ZGQ4_OPIVI|nr:hypothetical protein T265_09472 [Opisthorchis viverrini]KER22425.1 hypothetical protein T265_09472 [Opisthorchis viverrini]
MYNSSLTSHTVSTHELTDPRGSNSTSACRLSLPWLGQPGSISALVLPPDGMTARHWKEIYPCSSSMTFAKISVSFRTIVLSCLTLILSPVAASLTGYTEAILPEFVSLPPVRQVYIGSHVPLPEIRITCHAWPPPPLGNVTYYTRASRTAGGSGPRLHYQIPLHPLASSLMDSNGSTIILSSADSARSLASSDLHCLASTQFGAVLSPPFRVVLADPNRHSGQLVIQHAVEHWTTVIRCDLPPTTSSDSIQFTINGTRIEPIADKYRVIGSPGIPGKFNLVIRAFDGSDVGDYRCFTRDPLTGTDWFDSRRYQLTMHESSFTAKSLLSADFPQPVLSSGTYTPNIVVKQGQLVSLLCIPPVPFATNAFWIGRRPPTRASGGRIQLDRLFGILHIAHVTTDDEGAYYCSNGNWTSSVMLKVKRTPQVVIYPPEVRQPPGTEVRLTCVGSEPVPPVWYHNGRVLTSTVTSTGSNSSLHIPAVSDSTIGVYQCIQPGTDGDEWASAQAIVHYDYDAILRKADFDRITSESRRPIHLPPILLSVPTGKSTRLSCTLSGQNHSIPAGVLTSDVLPGISSAAKRLRLAEALNYVQIHWKKDGVQLQLPTQQSLLPPDEFELDVVRSRDFGVYECTVTTTNSRVLFTQVIHVKPSEPWATNQGSNLDPSLQNFQFKSEIQSMANELRPMAGLTSMDDQGDRGKRNTQQALRSSVADPWYSGPVDGLHNEAFHDMNPDAWLNSDPETPGHISRSLSDSDSGVSRLSKPNAEPVGDNLAVLISWSPIPTDYYQIQYRHRLPIDQRWSKAFTAESVIKECCGQNPACCTQQKQFYFTSRQPASLEPGRRYQFRVVAYVQQSIMGKSPWSQTISFEYISKVAPVFTETERLPDGGMVARWTLSTSAVGFPIDHFLLLCRKEERYSNGTVTYSPFQHIFVPGSDTRVSCSLCFVKPPAVLIRLLKTLRQPMISLTFLEAHQVGSVFEFYLNPNFVRLAKYTHLHTNLVLRVDYMEPAESFVYGECKLHNLEPGKGYQLVVYGVHTPPGMDPQAVVFKGGIGGRRITQFSHEIFVKPQVTPGEISVPETHHVGSVFEFYLNPNFVRLAKYTHLHTNLVLRVDYMEPAESFVYGECKLHNLEPGKGYQLVVYGVHTPPGMDPQAVVFKGGIGGRRITQFSHEIFVKPQVTPGEISVPETHHVNSGTGQARTENQLIFNSTESNRLMFLILGALAGMMLIIMICLVILCVWRQQRDKRRLLVYTSAAAKQASATKSPPPGQAGHHTAPQNFMLEHLNTLDTHRRRHASEHSSAFHPQPPPMSPPPPPPKHANQRDVELSSLLSAPPGMYPYPGQLVPSSANLHAPFNNTNPEYAYWINQHVGAGGTTLPMTGSNYSGQFMVPGNYPNGMNSVNNQPLNPPFGLKREPPSGGSVHDGTDTPPGQAGHHTAPQNFMLEHLNTLDTHRRRHASEHSSAFHPQPPPMSPPPPPPKHANQRDVELSSLLSAPPGMYPYPGQLVPSSANLHAPFNNTNPEYAYWINQHVGAGGTTLPMTGSNYSGQFMVPGNYPNGMNSVNNQPLNPPFGLKREPPSGGSVHDGTDTECDLPDQGLHQQLGYQVTSMAHSPFPMNGNSASKYQPPSVLSMPAMRQPANTAQLIFDPRTRQYHHTLQHLSYAQQPHNQWSGYNPGLMTPPPFNEDPNAYPGYGTDTASPGYPPAHLLSSEQQFLLPSFQPYTERYHHLGRQLPNPNAFQPPLPEGRFLQRSTSMTAQLHYHQQHPGTHTTSQEANPSESLRGATTHVSSVRGHAPSQEADFPDPATAMSYDTSSARKQRRRRRRLTAELRNQTQPGNGPHGVSEPLMTSSPVTPDTRGSANPIDHGHVASCFQHAQSSDAKTDSCNRRCPEHRTDASFNTQMDSTHPLQAGYSRHPNDELPQPNLHGLQMTPHWPQVIHHDDPTHFPGLLNHGHHNPGASGSVTRPNWVNGLLPDPPHVRDYSEYGIPNLHTTALNTNDSDANDSPELLTNDGNSVHPKHLTTPSNRPLVSNHNSDNFIPC